MLTATATASGEARQTATLEELARRADALALNVGTRITASTVLLACVVAIVLGAQSLLGTMQDMGRDLATLEQQLTAANEGLVLLNSTMDSVEPMTKSVGSIVESVGGTGEQVQLAVASIGAVADTTTTLKDDLGEISSSTTQMRGSLAGARDGSEQLAGTIGTLDRDLGPLVATQQQMLQDTRSMRTGLDGMNASLAYVIRVMNYISAPPTGGGMTIRADLPPETLPPIPGLRAEVEPIEVFPRNIWPVYRGR